ncbi:MAG: EamA family transporter [Steroidobacteraceae bacterium]
MRLSPLVLCCLAATWLVWGSTYLAIRLALPGFPPYWQMSSRFLVAGTALMIWCKLRGGAMPTLMQWRNALIVGGLMLGVGIGNTAVAEITIASGLVVAFIAITPAIITLLNLCYGIKPTRLEVLGILIGIAGVLLLTQGSGLSASPQGLLAISIAVMGWALGSVLSQQQCKLAPGAMGFASEMLMGGAVLFIMSRIKGETPQWQPGWIPFAAWLYLVVFGSLIAFNAYMLLLSRASAALAASYTFVNPMIAMALGIAIGGETVTGFEWLATGVVIVAVVLLVMGRRKSPAKVDSGTHPPYVKDKQ